MLPPPRLLMEPRWTLPANFFSRRVLFGTLCFSQFRCATADLVLDRRTLTVLYSMMSMKLIDRVYGCISCGKEANVYYTESKVQSTAAIRPLTVSPSLATLSPASGSLTVDSVKSAAIESSSCLQRFALKIYKTSILKFKDRRKYVEGEWRFERGYSKNPRKMVEMWAEKEFRNLRRLEEAGLCCPKVYFVKQNVLLMDLLCDGSGVAFPKLKDAFEHSRKLAKSADKRKYHADKARAKAKAKLRHMAQISTESKLSGRYSADCADLSDSDKKDANDDALIGFRLPTVVEEVIDTRMDDDCLIDADSSEHMEDSKEESGDLEEDTKMSDELDISDAMEEDIWEEVVYKAYLDVVRVMRDMYWKCRLVHGDLSEYNLLYDVCESRVYVIDVSQSVEQSHPNAFRFLAMDCRNVNNFFRKQQIGTLSHQELFAFVTQDIGYSFPDVKHLGLSTKTLASTTPTTTTLPTASSLPMDGVIETEKKALADASSETHLSRAEEYRLKRMSGKKHKKKKGARYSVRMEERLRKDAKERALHCELRALAQKWLELSLVKIKKTCKARFAVGSALTGVDYGDGEAVKGVDIPLSLHAADEECSRHSELFQLVNSLTLKSGRHSEGGWNPEEDRRKTLLQEVKHLLCEEGDESEEEEEERVDEELADASEEESDESEDDAFDGVSRADESDSATTASDDSEIGAMFPEIPLIQLQECCRKKMSREELREIRRRNKVIVKAEKRESRKHKLPKKVKKRKIKVARRKAGKFVWKK